MPITLGRGGGGGSGTGFALGPEQNEFTSAATRNTYATANPTWLSLYNADRSLWIQTGVNIQRRNAAGTGWETVTAAIRGPAGAASTVPGPAGAPGAASMVPGPAGAASTVPGPVGPIGATGAPGTPGGTGTATPPTTIVDAIAYTQHGTVTVGNWRDYDVLQFVFYNGSYYPAVLIATAALKLANAAAKQAHLAFEQNTSLNVYSTDDSDGITISFHNSGPALNANSTMTVLGWFTGNNGNDGIQGPVGPVGPGSTILAADESVDLPNPVTKINAVGAGIVATESGGVLTLTVAGGGMPATPTHSLYVGWSTDDTPEDAEFTANSDTHTIDIPTAVGNQYLLIWRSDTDGGDPSEVHISGGGNTRNSFGAAAAYMLNGVAGQVIVSVTTQNAGLLSGETLRVI